MSVTVVKNYSEMSQTAARIVASAIRNKGGKVNLCLPTGSTPKGMYEEMVRMGRSGEVDYSLANWFTLDEYLGIPEGHPLHCIQQLHTHFYQPAGVPAERIFTYNSKAESLDAEAEKYERLIADKGGLDLAVLGIGWNGHVGFNEPGADEHAGTHVVRLHSETLEQSKQYFGDNVLPDRGITMGIATLRKAGAILIIASGKKKAEVVRKALQDPVTSEVPASLLRDHAKVEFLLDEEAASELGVWSAE